MFRVDAEKQKLNILYVTKTEGSSQKDINYYLQSVCLAFYQSMEIIKKLLLSLTQISKVQIAQAGLLAIFYFWRN